MIKNKITSLLVTGCLMLGALAASAQSLSNNPPANVSAAQAAGDAVLDSVPGLNILTNIPTTTFDKATVEISLGLQNTGAELNNAIDGRWNFRTNFYAGAGLTLGAANVLNSAGISAGWRHPWSLWEVYAGPEFHRDFSHHSWAGGPVAGVAWKPSSGFSVYAEYETVLKNIKAAPSQSFKVGICFPF